MASRVQSGTEVSAPEQIEAPHLVLLGDSIIDNAAYALGGPAVIEHLRGLLPEGSRGTLLARDGDFTADVAAQFAGLPEDASHLVISVGGNDALLASNVFPFAVTTVREALRILAPIRRDFEQGYRAMLWQALAHQLPLAVCTIYDAVPGLQTEARTALSLFNDTITREAASAGIPVIDLRHICTEVEDYSAISPIEPSEQGGRKIAQAIIGWLAKTATVLQTPAKGMKGKP